MAKRLREILRESDNSHWDHYTTPGKGFELNRKLNAGEKLSDEESNHHAKLSAHIKANPLGSNKMLYRGQGHAPPDHFSSKGYLSFSAEHDTAMSYADNHASISGKHGHVVVLSAKKGAPISDIDHLSRYSGEEEHVLSPGNTIKIHKREFSKEHNVHYHYGTLSSK